MTTQSSFENSQRKFRNEQARLAARYLEEAKRCKGDVYRSALMRAYHRCEQNARVPVANIDN